MKKLFALIAVLVFSFGMALPQVAAESEVTTETTTEEVITEEITEENPYTDLTPEEIQILIDEAKAETINLVDRVFAWIGGLSGISAVLAFVFKWFKDRGYLNTIKNQIDATLASNVGLASKFDAVVEKLMLSEKREAALEKTVVSLITLSAIDPTLKAQVLEGLAKDTISVKDVIDAGLLTAAQQSESNAVVVENINVATQSLLEKLASK